MIPFERMALKYWYILLLFLVGLVGSLVPPHLAPTWFLENGLIEDWQLLHLSCCAALAARASAESWRARSADREGFLVIFLAFLWCTHREMDGIWERTDYSPTFVAIRAVLTFLVGGVALSRFGACWKTFRDNLGTDFIRNFLMGVAGYVIAQTVPPLLMLGGWSRISKRELEESIELIATGFLFVGAWQMPSARLMARRSAEDTDAETLTFETRHAGDT